MTPPIDAAERLRRIDNGEHQQDVYSEFPNYTHAQKTDDERAVINAYLRETDPTPITIDFARSVAVERDSGATTWFQIWGGNDQNAWLHHCFDGSWEMRNDKQSTPLIKTLGEFFTYCRLFGVTLKD